MSLLLQSKIADCMAYQIERGLNTAASLSSRDNCPRHTWRSPPIPSKLLPRRQTCTVPRMLVPGQLRRWGRSMRCRNCRREAEVDKARPAISTLRIEHRERPIYPPARETRMSNPGLHCCCS